MAEHFVVTSDDTTELRMEIPKWVVAVADAICCARGGQAAGMSRGKLLVPILIAWAESESRQATMVANVLRGNPNASASSRQPTAPPMDDLALDGMIDRLQEMRGQFRR